MKSNTFRRIDEGAAWVETRHEALRHWIKLHYSWAYRQYRYEEQFTVTIAITGRLRERVRRLAIERIRKDLIAMGATGPFVTGDGLATDRACPDWLAALPQTGVVRTPPVDHELAMHEHKATARR